MHPQPVRILVIEDESAHAEAVARSLESMAGMELRVMVSLREFREQAMAWQPDLVLMDLNLPDGRATEVLADPTDVRPFPIVVMTSYGSEQVAVEALKQGALDYLVKSPETFQRLPQTLQQLLREWQLRLDARGLQQALRASEEAYRRQFADSASIMLLIDPADGRILDANAAAEAFYGYSRPQLLAMRISEINALPVSEVQRAMASATQVRGTRFEFQHRLADGSLRDVVVSCSRIGSGDRQFLHSIIHDITDQKCAEAALREAHQFSEQIIREVQEGIIVYGPDLRYQVWNPYMERLTGLPACDVLGRHPAEVFPFLQAAGVLERLHRALAGEAISDLDFPYCLASTGKSGWASDSLAAFCSTKGEIIGVIGTVRDITARKQAEEILEKRLVALTQPMEDGPVAFEDLFNLAEIQHIQDEFAAATGVASILTRPDGTPLTEPTRFTQLCSEIIRKTEKGCANCLASDAILGRSHPEGPIVQPCLSGGLWDAGVSIIIGGHHIANWLIGQVRDEHQTEAAMRAYAQEIGADETEYLRAFQAVPVMPRARLEQIARALFTLANQLSTTAYQNLMQARHITERKQAEEERSKLHERLSQVQKLEALGVLVAGVAHNLNNVLAAILATASLHERLTKDPQGLEAFRLITTACKRGRDVVKSLTHFAQPSLASQGPLELHSLIREVRSLMASTTRNRIQILEAFHGEPLWLQGNAGSLNHALMNLCLNALDAMPNGGTLTFRTTLPSPDWIEVSIEDTGAGMVPEVLARVKEPFFTTKEVGKGTGLGLSMTHGVIKAHGGTLELASVPSQGTTVTLRLPRIAIPTLQPLPEALAPTLGPLHVLLVDDDEDVRFLVARMLTKAGLQVQTVGGGEEALASLGSGPLPDLIILDQNMPRMNGIQTMDKIRALHLDMPILISSGQPEIEAWPCFKQPNVAVIAKPFEMEEMLAKLARIAPKT